MAVPCQVGPAQRGTSTSGTSSLWLACARVSPSLAAGLPALVSIIQDQRDLPTSPADPDTQFPMCFTATA